MINDQVTFFFFYDDDLKSYKMDWKKYALKTDNWGNF